MMAKEAAVLGCLLVVLLSVCANCKPAADRAAADRAAADRAAADRAVTDQSVNSQALSDTQDSRWRMISALSYLNTYSRSRFVVHRSPAMISINQTSDNHTLLAKILNGTCNLLAFYELAIKVNNSDSKFFIQVADEILKESCNWMKYLANQTDAPIITNHSIDNVSCVPTDVTLLHQYCFRARISHLRSMTDIGNHTLVEYTKAYHGKDRNPVPGPNARRWLATTSIPQNTRDTIYTDIVMAILQYILEMDLLQL